MKNIIISREVMYFLHLEKRMCDPNIVIYRDILNLGCGYARAFTFITRVKVIDGKKPNEYFVMYDRDNYGIPIWIEKGLLTQLENKPILISMRKKGFFKGLKLEIGTQIFKRQ
jgi:hypothetical protein